MSTPQWCEWNTSFILSDKNKTEKYDRWEQFATQVNVKRSPTDMATNTHQYAQANKNAHLCQRCLPQNTASYRAVKKKNLTGEGCSVIWRTKEAGNSCHPEQPLNNQFNKLEVNCWCNAEFIGNSKEVCTSVQGDMKQAQKRSWWQVCTGTCAGTGTGKKTDLLTDRQTKEIPSICCALHCVDFYAHVWETPVKNKSEKSVILLYFWK